MKHLCQCEVGCEAVVKTASKKYARGHHPNVGLHSGHPNKTSFKKGQVPWNKGKKGIQVSWIKGLTKGTDPRVKRLSEALKGRKHYWARASGYVGPNKGRVVPEEERRRISKTMKRVRRTTSPIWNKGLKKKDHPGIASAAKKNSLLSKGKSRPFTSVRQGIRRFWYYGPKGRMRMRSSWEVAYARWLDEQEVDWLYEPICFVTNEFSYTPDFYLSVGDKFVEIKGYKGEVDERKIQAVQRNWRTTLLVLRGKDLEGIGILDNNFCVIGRFRARSMGKRSPHPRSGVVRISVSSQVRCFRR